MDKESDRCGNCKYWVESQDFGGFGVCDLHSRLHGSIDIQPSRGGFFVSTPEDFYCSDHEEK